LSKHNHEILRQLVVDPVVHVGSSNKITKWHVIVLDAWGYDCR